MQTSNLIINSKSNQFSSKTVLQFIVESNVKKDEKSGIVHIEISDKSGQFNSVKRLESELVACYDQSAVKITVDDFGDLIITSNKSDNFSINEIGELIYEEII